MGSGWQKSFSFQTYWAYIHTKTPLDRHAARANRSMKQIWLDRFIPQKKTIHYRYSSENLHISYPQKNWLQNYFFSFWKRSKFSGDNVFLVREVKTMPSFLGYDLRILILEALPWRDFLMNTNHCWLICVCLYMSTKKKRCFQNPRYGCFRK